jgi:hypothetical protein
MIKPKYVIEFDIELDKTHTISYDVLGKFCDTYTTGEILNLISHTPPDPTNSTLILETTICIYCKTLFDYFIDIGALEHTDYDYFFWVIDIDRFRAALIELHKVYDDLSENYKIYERDFIIDKVLDI